MTRSHIRKGVFAVLALGAAAAGAAFFAERRAAWFLTVLCAALLMIPLLRFEKSEADAKHLTVVAVMTALSVAGRMIFLAVPFFKPVTAAVILAGLGFGPAAGFMTGTLSALISNFYFGQGPWTPFQMLIWGGIGLAAGRWSGALTKRPPLLYLFAALSGVIFSLIMDLWSVLWTDGTLLPARYLAALAAALPITVLYAASNVVFLFLLRKPFEARIRRVKEKYGL